MFQTALISAVLVAAGYSNEIDSEAEFGFGGYGFGSPGFGAFNEVDYLGTHNARVPQKPEVIETEDSNTEDSSENKEILNYGGV